MLSRKSSLRVYSSNQEIRREELSPRPVRPHVCMSELKEKHPQIMLIIIYPIQFCLEGWTRRVAGLRDDYRKYIHTQRLWLLRMEIPQ